MLYGITVGDIYTAADGSNHFKRVLDITTYGHCDDVVVIDCDSNGNPIEGTERRMDAFKLHMVRYTLIQKGIE